MEGLDFSMDYSRRAAESLTWGNIMAFTVHCVIQYIVGTCTCTCTWYGRTAVKMVVLKVGPILLSLLEEAMLKKCG